MCTEGGQLAPLFEWLGSEAIQMAFNTVDPERAWAEDCTAMAVPASCTAGKLQVQHPERLAFDFAGSRSFERKPRTTSVA